MSKERQTNRHRAMRKKAPVELSGRSAFLRGVIFVIAAVLIGRLFHLQVLRHPTYKAAADRQQLDQEVLPSLRGTIYMQDYETQSLVPVATSQRLAFVFVNPSEFEDVQGTIDTLVRVLGLTFDEEEEEEESVEVVEEVVTEAEVADESAPAIVGTELDGREPIVEEETEEIDDTTPSEPTEYERFVARLSNPDDPYEPIKHGVPEEQLTELRSYELPGVYFTREETRLYPESGVGGHVIGFVGLDEEGNRVGRYGTEGFFDELLAGEDGYLHTRTDITGREVPVAEREYQAPEHGADIVLTIDRTIQFVACDALRRAVLRHGAQGGSVIIMDPNTGDILAMCGYPDFDPEAYNEVERIDVFNNPGTFGAYEPGSIFKSITMAAGLDVGAITPSSTYEDTGEVKVPPFTIRNSDRKAHGVVTMTEILERSLNTGMVHVVSLVGNDRFREYVQQFGFGANVGIKTDTERAGDISPLEKDGDIFTMTASYGQGITVTPIQMVQAYGAFANDGILVKPQLVKEIRYPNGVIEPATRQEVRRVISSKAARLLSAMMVSVVENGHAGNAGVDGYYVAGKTGTAQVARDGVYSKDESIGSFVGYGPVSRPEFVMLTRIDIPANNGFSSTTAAPLFGEIAEFLFDYLNIPPERPEDV